MPTQTFTTGNDTFTVPAGPGTYDLDFLAGDDRLNVLGGDSTTATMGDGNDLVELKAGLATVTGDAGNDTFDIWANSATVDGGADSDTINFRGGDGQTAHGGTEADRFNFFADVTNVSVFGDDGNDKFVGYYHNITGTIDGGAGNDSFLTFGPGVTLAGGTGNDVYRATASGAATFVENPGEGIDGVQVARGHDYTLPDNIENISVQGFTGSDATATATLTGNGINNRIVGHNNSETIWGLDGNDTLVGKGGDDTIHGGNGNDYIDGGSGNDTITGDVGNDMLQGRTGDDNMAGGTGNDTYYVDSLGDVVTENSGEGTDLVRVSVSGYTLPSNVENGFVNGSPALTLTGNSLDNLLVGNAGDDHLNGADGNDTIKGGAGNDTIDGSTGNDMIYGNGGTDTLTGGTGNDTFVFTNITDSPVGSGDSITDFTSLAGEGSDDQIDLSHIDANTALDGDQGFAVSLTGPAANSIWASNDVTGHEWVLQGDVNGDGVADFEIHFHTAGVTFQWDDITP